MIRLKNVSKFYYSKGVVASGFSKVNLEFKMGEFVAITGESGSGKSTLLNVISGLDSYEEGEMYINGEETSHYTEKDFEDYRRKYVGNIFQNFNLVNSYTVYQNVELVLLLNGCKKKEIKKKVLDLIRKVDLYRFRNTKVSKLSGGQKQRVAIARALAKDTPMIIADEPTGNLDSRSAKGIIKLLSEIAKDKLVIIVTHNYEQVEEYVTRKIKMHDGKVLEDKQLKEIDEVKEEKSVSVSNLTFFNKLRLGFRNTFNIVPKFLLLLFVYLFITVALMSEYSSFKEQQYIASKSGYNHFFKNTSDQRIILKKKDHTAFLEEDYEKISKISWIDSIVQNDLLLDNRTVLVDHDYFWLSGGIDDLENFKEKLDVGRMPEKENEIVVEGSKDDYYLSYQLESLMDTDLYFQDYFNGSTGEKPIRIVGVKYVASSSDTMTFYVGKGILDDFSFLVNQQFSTTRVLFQGKYDNYLNISYSDLVPQGTVYMSDSYQYQCPNQNCISQGVTIEVENPYFNDSKNFYVSQIFRKDTLQALLDLSEYDTYSNTVFMNKEDYRSFFNKGNYQTSVFVSEVEQLENVQKELEDLGYETYAMKDSLVASNFVEVIRIFSTVVTIILVVTLFFITYFVIRIILKSRNVYFSIIRMLGATEKISKQLLIIELLTISNLAYFSVLIGLLGEAFGAYHIGFLATVLKYLKPVDYFLLYFILITMSYLISQKFAKKLFKHSAISTRNEEV